MLAWTLLVSAAATTTFSLIGSVSKNLSRMARCYTTVVISIPNILSRIASQLQASRLHNNKDRNCHPIFCNNGLQHIRHNPRI